MLDKAPVIPDCNKRLPNLRGFLLFLGRLGFVIIISVGKSGIGV